MAWNGRQNMNLIYPQIGLTFVCTFLILYVSCRDPGFINPAKYDSTNVKAYEANEMDLNTPFINSQIYKARYCSTCKITRPPLSSHCKFCNACVINFDHHCTVINQCIGARNHRAFVLCLLFALLQFLYLICLTLLEVIYVDIIMKWVP
jgi:hypothetical protein